MRKDGWTDEQMKNDKLSFLYAKGVMIGGGKSSTEPVIALKNILDPDEAKVSEDENKLLKMPEM